MTNEIPARSPTYRSHFPAARGFTLIELLVVIAIIAILAALIIPIFAIAKEGSRRGTCEENLHQIYEALKLYRLDWNGDPPDIWQMPATGDRWRYGLAALYPDYLKGLNSLHCPDDPSDKAPDPAHVVIGPDPQNDPQDNLSSTTTIRFDSYDGPDEYAASVNASPPNNVVYKYASSDIPSQLPQHYSRIPGSEEQLGRQLSLLYPNSTTVITWCTQHRPRTNSISTPVKSQLDDIFLFADGSVRRMTYAGFNIGCKATVNGFKDVDCR